MKKILKRLQRRLLRLQRNKQVDFAGLIYVEGHKNQSTIQWSWRESNPRPNIFLKSFLHAYFIINCRHKTGNEQTNSVRSCMGLSRSHSLLQRHPVLILSRRRSLVTGQPAFAALMTI
jgi:hypothetical protein